MRIAISTNLFPPAISGTSSYSSEILDNLAKLGHEVYLIIPKRSADLTDHRLGINPDRVLFLPSWKVPSSSVMLGFNQLRSTLIPGNARKVLNFLIKNNIQYVYQQSHAFDTAFYTRYACKKLRIPRAVAHHTNISHPNPIVNRILRWAEVHILGAFFLKQDDLWICLDDFTLEYCKQRFPHMHHKKVMYGVSPFPECIDNQILKEAKSYKEQHEPLILSLGHITSCRDRIDLIRSLLILKKIYPRIGLIIIGDNQVSYPVEEVKKLGLDLSVHFMGKRPRETIRPFIEIADLEAHWYYDNSTFGMATLETMSSGVCCLASCPEECYGPGLFQAGKHYWRVQAGNPEDIANNIDILLKNTSLRHSIAKQGAALVRDNFSWNRIADNLIEVFEAHIREGANNG